MSKLFGIFHFQNHQTKNVLIQFVNATQNSFRSVGLLSKTFQKHSVQKNDPLPLDDVDEERKGVVKEENTNEAPLTVVEGKPIFPEVVHEVKHKVGFWEREDRIKLKDSILTLSGRLLRITISAERYDNWWEAAQLFQDNRQHRRNKLDIDKVKFEGGEFNLCEMVFRLSGAVKIQYDDRWVDHVSKLRIASKKDCAVEAVDLRRSYINFEGMSHFAHVGYVRYLNVADSKLFDNSCMTRLHPISHSLEYLDISGTSVTAEAFTYLRLFPHLKWLNVSRLSNEQQIQSILPFLREILPYDCVVITNDKLPAESYGSEIPFRSLRNAEKDLWLTDKPIPGDVQMFASKYGHSIIEHNDASVIHHLWQTPELNKERKLTFKLGNPKKKMFLETVVKYVHKAEEFKPIL